MDSDDVAQRDSVEVAISETSSPASRTKNWISKPIDDNMGNLPVIPLPAPSSLSSIRRNGVPPLQQRDTNADLNSRISQMTIGSKDKESNIKGPFTKRIVPRPIESSRGRNTNFETGKSVAGA